MSRQYLGQRDEQAWPLEMAISESKHYPGIMTFTNQFQTKEDWVDEDVALLQSLEETSFD
jgi:hypothetical protein